MSVEDEAKKILLKLGLWWPDANSGSLRAAATAWRTFADSVDDVRGPVHTSASSLIHHNTGESIDAFEKFWNRYAKGKDAGWLSDLAESSGRWRRPWTSSRTPSTTPSTNSGRRSASTPP
ncbi:hypothetical protein ACFZDP_03750 [Streptomyces mirabilis]|uniref:hypothetical protein n=1 Tax=Streptomyces mirabilis TaxID=68239 RepID=UPI0036E893BE